MKIIFEKMKERIRFTEHAVKFMEWGMLYPKMFSKVSSMTVRVCASDIEVNVELFIPIDFIKDMIKEKYKL